MQRIEKSAFRRGEYVGYAHGPWEIRKSNSSYGNWLAVKIDSPNERLYAFKLADLDRKLGEWESAHPLKRESNPSRRSIHTAKWDRCVKDISARGGAKSAAAVCTATIGYEGSVKKGHRSHNPTWHQRKGMKRRGPPKFEPGWYIADDTGGFLSYIGPMKTEKEARELLEVRAKNGATGNVFHVPARSENPLPSVRKVYYIICAVKGAEKYYLARSGKLTRAQAGAARFATAQAAIDKAKVHLKNYAASRKYRFDLKLAY